MPLPCRAKSKSPIPQISRRGIYGDDAPAGDSFHVPTPERMAAVKAWWSNEDYHREATVKDVSISVPLHPGWHDGKQVIVLDIDDASLRDAVANAPALQRCPVNVGKKGSKLFAFLDPAGGRPADPITQYVAKDDPDHPALEIFTGSKHALLYGEHPASTPSHPIFYEITRGFGEPFPVLTWEEICAALEPIIQEHDLVLKKSKADREIIESMPTYSRPRGGRTITDRLGLSITDVCSISDGVRCGDEIRGSHPVHGSATGQNFSINPGANAWHCFRCETGGGPLEWIAVEAEIIDCSEVRPGCLQGQWREVFEVLRAKGYDLDALLSPEEGPDPGITLDTMAEALEVLEDGDPVAYLLDVFHTEHAGDSIVAKCCYVSAASRVVANSKGIHVLTIGPSGKGKSSVYETVQAQMPDGCVFSGGLSDKALLYHDVPEKSVIVLDDRAMSEAVQELFRNATSDIRVENPWRTVGQNRQPMTLTIAPRCVWWMASAEDVVDDQFHNRCLQPWVDSSEEADRTFAEHFLASVSAGGDGDTDPRFEVCKAMWGIISEEVLPVWVWFAQAIEFQDVTNRRNLRIFVDLVMAFTRIRFKQRQIDERGMLVATLEDFESALDLYGALVTDQGSQALQLTPEMNTLLRVIREQGLQQFSINDLVQRAGMSYQKVRRILKGRSDRNLAGLLDRCPVIQLKQESVSVETNEGLRRGYREDRFMVDLEALETWMSGRLVTLNREKLGELVTRFSQSFPSLFPALGKKTNSQETAQNTHPSLYNNIINNNNNNNNVITQKRGERECVEDTPRSTLRSGFGKRHDRPLLEKSLSEPKREITQDTRSLKSFPKLGNGEKRGKTEDRHEGLSAWFEKIRLPRDFTVANHRHNPDRPPGLCSVGLCNRQPTYEDETGSWPICEHHYELIRQQEATVNQEAGP